jgi:hypothetical protein
LEWARVWVERVYEDGFVVAGGAQSRTNQKPAAAGYGEWALAGPILARGKRKRVYGCILMRIKDFSAKVEAVKRFQTMPAPKSAQVAKALGVGYRVTLPFLEGTETFFLKGPEVARLLAEFPGTEALWQLFRRPDATPSDA